MVDAGIEIDVLKQMLLQQRQAERLGQSTETAPVIRHRTAAMRNDELQLWKLRKNIRGEQLHEGGRVAVEIMRAGGMERRVTGRTDVDHRRHVEVDQLLVDRIPIRIRKRRVGPISARWVR